MQALKPGMCKLVGRLSLSEDHADKWPVMNYELGAGGRAKALRGGITGDESPRMRG